MTTKEQLNDLSERFEKTYPPKKQLAAVPTFTPRNFFDQIQFFANKMYVWIAGSWQAVGSSTAYASGVFSKDLSDASVVQTIAHGLGAIPKYIKLTGMLVTASAGFYLSTVGVYNGTSTKTIYMYDGISDISSTPVIIFIPATGGNNNNAVATFDATNITLTWTKNGSPTGAGSVLWEAFI